MGDNTQFLIHQMTMKGKRLTSGLEKFVKAVEGCEDPKGYAYWYALGCLGGDYVQKKLMKTHWLPKVVEEMVANKLMKEDKGEKLLAEWKATYVEPEKAEEKAEEPVAVEEKKVEETPSSFSFKFDTEKGTTEPDQVPKCLISVYYDILDQFKVARNFPRSFQFMGVRWEEKTVIPEKPGSKLYRVAYSKADNTDYIG